MDFGRFINPEIKGFFWLALSNRISRQQTPDVTTLNYWSSSTACSIVH
jgi:hypothetical protein